MAQPDGDDLKKRYILTAGFVDQEALMAPPEGAPGLEHALPLPRPVPPAPPPEPPPIGVHHYVVDPASHPAWDEVVQRTLAAGLPAWLAQLHFRLVMLALHGRDGEARHSALGQLARLLDAQLVPAGPLMVGPARLDAPAASPIASPQLAGVALYAGLDLAEADPEAVVSLMATLAGWAAWHAPGVQAFGPTDAAPLDMVVAMARALHRPIQETPIAVHAGADPRSLEERLGSGIVVVELAAARQLAREAPEAAIIRLPELVRSAGTPAAALALMEYLAQALRTIHDLESPAPDTPGWIAQCTAHLASPLESVRATALQLLSTLARVDDAELLGLDLPTRYAGALAETRAALAAHRTVPRWVIANIQGADRALLCAMLLGRLPSADPVLLQALVDLAPAELEPALRETLREPWVPAAAKAAAREALKRKGRLR